MQEVKRGDRISLNTSKRLYYFQDENGINLRVDGTESAIIPKTTTDEQLKQINIAVRNEHLVPGILVKDVEVPDRDSDIRKILDGGRNKIGDWIGNLREDKNVKNELKVSILEKLIDFEKSGKNRVSVIKTAEATINSIGGISPVIETEQQEIEIKLTSGTEEQAETK